MERKIRFLVFAIVLLVFSVGQAQAEGFFEGIKDSFVAKGNGIDYMNNGQYRKAINELEKVSDKQDIEIQLALIKCYLLTNYDSKANQIAEAVSKNPEYKNANDQIAQVYLETLDSCHNNNCSFTRLIQADQFATNQDICRKIGNIEKLYAVQFQGNQKTQLMHMTARHLGEENVFEFKIERIAHDTYKITFFTDKPVNVFEWKKGIPITFVKVSDPSNVLMYYSKYQETSPVRIGQTRTTNVSTPLEFKGRKGEYVIFESDQLSDTE